MKPLTPLLLPALALIGAARLGAADPEAVVRFSNNDRLAGSVQSLSADLLVWKSPLLEKPSAFFLKNVLDLSLPATTPGDVVEHEAILKLTNGDSICGQLASVTDERIALDTWFAGRMNFNRLMVEGLKIAAKSTFVYRGPNGMEDWVQTGDTPAWTYSRSAFRSKEPGGIGRDELLPEECIVTFDVAWQGDALGLKVVLFAEDPSADTSSSGYEIAFQRGSIYLRNGKTQSFLGSTNAQVLMENDRARIEMRVSSKSGKVSLTINDRLIEVWSDPDVAKGKFGRGLLFNAQTASPLRISAIGVANWDGVLDRLPEPRVGMMRQFGMPLVENLPKPPPTADDATKGSRMELANGDSLLGEVLAITDGVIDVKTPLGDVKLPVSRLRSLALKPVDLERCKRRNGDIRAWFPDGTSIVFRLDGVEGDKLVGSSQNFGSATFQTAAFNRLEFNIYDPELEDKRSPGDW